jgi:hypothetical protein
MLIGSFCSEVRGSKFLRHGQLVTLPAYREHLNYCVSPAEQGKPVSLLV